MGRRDGETQRLAGMFAAAALDHEAWLPALGALASATRSGRGELVVLSSGTDSAGSYTLVANQGGLDLDRFMAAGGYDPAVNPRIAVAHRSRVMEVAHEIHYDLVTPHLRNADALLDYSRQAGIEFGCQAMLLNDPDGQVGLSVLRDASDGRTSAEDRALFAAILPHVRDAARVQNGIERQGLAMVTGALEAMAAAAFLLDGQGRLIRATPAGEALLATHRLRLAGGRLAAATPGADQALAHAIGTLLAAGDALAPAATVLLTGPAAAAPLIADISPLPAHDWAFRRRPRVLVVIRAGLLRQARGAETLRAAWDLSPAEAEIALRIAAGDTRDTIAVARKVARETVRSQIKAIFAKAGVTREAELIARIAGLVGTR